MNGTDGSWPSGGFEEWIGRQEEAADIVSPALADRFRAVLPLRLAEDGRLPLCLHWCLAPIAEPAARLGPDGHPRLGTHLPPVPLPRRMWAGGTLEFHDDLEVGDEVSRLSTVRSIERKTGRSGDLVFVAHHHALRTARGPAITEIQDLVYRQPAGAAGRGETGPAEAEPLAEIETDPVLLFRYSAITFNGHRIHYDHPYATEVEGYGGLVVHGPLIATLLANLARRELGAVRRFAFRGRSPLICGERLLLFADRKDGGISLAARSGEGRLVMSAEAND